MSNNEIYELSIWEGDFGLPTIDVNSLIVYTYLKCLKKECSVKYCTNPLFNTLPGLSIRSINLVKKIDVSNFTNKWVKHQEKDLPDIDLNLTTLQQTESRIYYMYLKENYLPALWDTVWFSEQNYFEFTRKWHRNAMPFPLNFLYPWWKRSKVTSHLKSLMTTDSAEEFSNLLLDKAKMCLDNLSWKLSNQNYFLGTEKPCMLDIIIYAYLSTLIMSPLPSSQLQIYAKQQNNLVKHVERMSQLFPSVKVKYKYVEKSIEQDAELHSNPGTVIMAVLIAATTMIGYGMIIGVIRTSKM